MPTRTLAAETTAETDLEKLRTDGAGLDAANAVAGQFAATLKSYRCTTTLVPETGVSTGKTAQFAYAYRVKFPTFGKTCSGQSVRNYFSAGTDVLQAANQVKYLYNAQQSSSQFTADMLTATFPRSQAILAGTATAGAGQSSTVSSEDTATAGRTHQFAAAIATSSSAPTIDSVATAVARIQNGGDFNVRFPLPLLFYQYGNASITSGAHPNVGFNIDQFSGQSTITGSTEYTFNVPIETYLQLLSTDTDTNGIATAALFLDLQPSAQVVSSELANKIGLTGSRAFFLGQAAAGIQFSNSIGISFQYFYGPKQALASTDANGATTMTTPRIQGFHLAVSFSPQKKSKS